MKFLAIVGTIAMFMVGGGILVHGIHVLNDGISTLASMVASVAAVGPALATVTPTLGGMLIGMIAGSLVLGLVTLWQRVRAARL